ncbi:hypothetical protein HYH03_018886 [Edaphochlamys debaryana]|uniref:CxC3 like cysteine cluster domain-containing protein n=1 Tax=Edaphochlamys debaryana TaxID=47281 RepID=A0A835XCZ2_9CHLO|nr:hypothetical protein HYH03_018886 [Edaphochlamys debaryana]|eukprot:KAG2482162.1 hypothetical protein HYH03_018886 [Edaphochlamys debaryana]
MADQLRVYTQQLDTLSRERSALVLGHAQRRVDTLAARAAADAAMHATSCPGARGGAMQAPATEVPAAKLTTGVATVTYVSLVGSGALQVPHTKCECGAVFTVQPIPAGCFPLTPVSTCLWFDLDVHRAYRHLGLQDGLSAAGFVDFLSAQAACKLDDRAFVPSFFSYLRSKAIVEDWAALGVEGMDAGPFGGCAICAETPAVPGEDTDPYRLSVSLDAVTKLGHYASCGTATRGLPHHISTFFGAVDGQVQAAYSAGALELERVVSGRVGAQAAGEEPSCRSSLHCARPNSSSAGPCDVHGVVGAVCMHTVPVRGGFCDMPKPEQFSYYLLMLHHLVQQRPDLKDVYIDFGCQIRSTWRRYVANHPELPQAAKDLRIMVNWMHGSGHEIACQLVNSGRYSPAAARRIGEEIEQLWSMTKSAGSLVRYMSLHHRRDFIEALLADIGRDKLKRIVVLTEKRYADTIKLLDAHRKALASVMSEAAKAAPPVLDPQVAAEEYKRVVLGTEREETTDGDAWKVEYARLCLRLGELKRLQISAPSLAVVSSSASVALATASTDDALSKVRAALTAMEHKRDLPPTERSKWTKGYEPFDCALDKLRRKEVERCQSRIEQLVLEIRALHSDRAAAGCADKETKSMQARGKRKRAQVRALLEEMYVWQSVGGGSSARLTEQQLKSLFDPGTPMPWGNNESLVRLHHGRRYLEAAADLARTSEEEATLRVEKKRLGAWVRHAASCLQAARERAAACEGTVFLIDQHLALVDQLRTELGRSRIPV